MQVVIRVDSSKSIGTGHVMRCLTFARVLRSHGASVHFVCRYQEGHVGDMIITEGFQTTFLPHPSLTVRKQSVAQDTEHCEWLGVTQDVDAAETTSTLRKLAVRLLIVDHYGLDEHWEKIVKQYTQSLLVIDDFFDRRHAADLIVNPNFTESANSDLFDTIGSRNCKALIGPRYSFVRPEYRSYRKSFSTKSNLVERVLVYLGGSVLDASLTILFRALSAKEFDHLHIDFVLGPNTINGDKLKRWLSRRPRTTIHGQRAHLADLMAQADISIGAGGSTTWERMCIGLPSIVIAMSENQVSNAEALARNNLIQYVGRAGEFNTKHIHDLLLENIQNYHKLKPLGQTIQGLVDGLGAQRVREAIWPSRKEDLQLRFANLADCSLYFTWVNDPTVRSASLQSSPVDLTTHRKWFSDKLDDANAFLFVLESNELPIGQIRFDCHSGEAVVAYSLDEIVRGRGWAEELVLLGVKRLQQFKHISIKAVVKATNESSIRVFSNLGYSKSRLPSSVDSNNVYVFRQGA